MIRLLLAVLALLAGPVAARPAPRPLTDLSAYSYPKAPLPDAATVRATPALWVVRDRDTAIYLFGTVHILKPGLDWFDGPVRDAFQRSDELVIEMVEPSAEVVQQTSLRLGLDPSGVPLREKLTPDARARYEAALTTLGVPVESFDAMRPWLAGMTLGILPLVKSGFETGSGVERSLLNGNRKPVEGLETFDEQLGYFAQLTEEDQIAYLNAVVDGLGDYGSEVDGLVDAWAAGDVDRVAALMDGGIADSPPAVKQVLLVDRNARWAKWIRQRLRQPGTVFLAVGAGHLAGPDSVQAKLAASGMIARRVKN